MESSNMAIDNHLDPQGRVDIASLPDMANSVLVVPPVKSSDPGDADPLIWISKRGSYMLLGWLMLTD